MEILESLTVGERVVVYRKRRGLAQKVLAGRLGVDPHTLRSWERGVTEPVISQAIRLADILGVSLRTLTGRQ